MSRFLWFEHKTMFWSIGVPPPEKKNPKKKKTVFSRYLPSKMSHNEGDILMEIRDRNPFLFLVFNLSWKLWIHFVNVVVWFKGFLCIQIAERAQLVKWGNCFSQFLFFFFFLDTILLIFSLQFLEISEIFLGILIDCWSISCLMNNFYLVYWSIAALVSFTIEMIGSHLYNRSVVDLISTFSGIIYVTLAKIMFVILFILLITNDVTSKI